MTSRRSFLLSCSSVSLLSVAGQLAMARSVEQSKVSKIGPMQPDHDFSQIDVGIYGWHTPHIDTEKMHLICLNASWKADWL